MREKLWWMEIQKGEYDKGRNKGRNKGRENSTQEEKGKNQVQ